MQLNFEVDLSMSEWCDRIVDVLDNSEFSTLFNHLYVSILTRRGESALKKSIEQNHYIAWYEENKTVLTKKNLMIPLLDKGAVLQIEK